MSLDYFTMYNCSINKEAQEEQIEEIDGFEVGILVWTISVS